MSVRLIELNGKNYWRMYLCERVRLPGGKVKKLQKNLLFDTDKYDKAAVEKERKSWKRKLLREANNLENQDLEFGEILRRFEVLGKSQFVGKRITPKTLQGHINLVKKYCVLWQDKVASEITRGDGRELLRVARDQHSASITQQKRIKTAVNLLFNWAIEEKFVTGVHNSPVFGLYIEDEEEEKVPPILSLEQVQRFLASAKSVNHPWYPVWACAVMTGMRSGELFALKWSNIDFQNRIIRVCESYSWDQKVDKSTKAGYWRNVPISKQLYALLQSLQSLRGDCENVFPRLPGWENGEAAKFLRNFLESIGINDYVVFHTLRACFATHLLATGAEPAKVMAIGGWKDLKTFQIYIRLSGINVAGVTDNLSNSVTKEVEESDLVDGVSDLYNVAS